MHNYPPITNRSYAKPTFFQYPSISSFSLRKSKKTIIAVLQLSQFLVFIDHCFPVKIVIEAPFNK